MKNEKTTLPDSPINLSDWAHKGFADAFAAIQRKVRESDQGLELLYGDDPKRFPQYAGDFLNLHCQGRSICQVEPHGIQGVGADHDAVMGYIDESIASILSVKKLIERYSIASDIGSIRMSSDDASCVLIRNGGGDGLHILRVLRLQCDSEGYRNTTLWDHVPHPYRGSLNCSLRGRWSIYSHDCSGGVATVVDGDIDVFCYGGNAFVLVAEVVKKDAGEVAQTAAA